MPRAKATHCPQGHAYDEANTYVCSESKQHCRTCNRDAARDRQRRRPNHVKRAEERSWKQRNPEKIALIRLREHVKRTFGLTLPEYQRILARGCAICGTTQKLVLDHCHDTGKIRDALCNNCNAGLGFMGDDPARCEAAAVYLRDHGKVG